MGWFRTYRALITIVLVVTLVVFVPRLRSDNATTRVEGASPGVGTSAGPNTLNPSAGSEPVGGTSLATSGGTAPGGGPSSASGAGSVKAGGAGTTPTTAAGGSRAPTVNLSDYPGIGSAAALKNPNCDPATGKMRIPSLFAPECVAQWPAGADNGGATSSGVTKDAIKIAIYENPHPEAGAAAANGAGVATSGSPPTKEQIETEIRKTLAIYNDHLELWGRKIEIVFVPWTSS